MELQREYKNIKSLATELAIKAYSKGYEETEYKFNLSRFNPTQQDITKHINYMKGLIESYVELDEREEAKEYENKLNDFIKEQSLKRQKELIQEAQKELFYCFIPGEASKYLSKNDNAFMERVLCVEYTTSNAVEDYLRNYVEDNN
ncbi:hypothetical protein [Vallitalea sp.]|jgi:hypothetical protein|uniref:hypothetical protein n=1 Tax=Vallitalea sp. TaxID=1882829 RepID=UPI0025FB59FA|nr:hypothetical protein [Vallitalea sp.]MCT4686843.1 hypothetical protein [Vallitalea sp.]